MTVTQTIWRFLKFRRFGLSEAEIKRRRPEVDEPFCEGKLNTSGIAETPKILAVFIEPTPYILGFIKALEKQYHRPIDVFFLKKNHSQAWNLSLPESYSLLSGSSIKDIATLTHQINQANYALIHLAGWGHLVNLYLLFLGKLKRIPVSIESDTQLSSHEPQWRRQIKYWIYKRPLYRLLFKLPAVFLPGGTRQSLYFQHFGVNPNKIVIAQMTVDVEALQQKCSTLTQADREILRCQYEVAENDVVFLFVARLLPLKGIQELMRVFRIFKQPMTQLWIVGDGELINDVKANVEGLTNMKYFGRQEGEALMHIYHAADVVVLPSYAEPWGLVVNEAMAMGKAVIVSENAGCVDDLIIHNHTGLLIPSKNIPSLAGAIDRLTYDSALRRTLSVQAKKHIASWTLENEAKNVIGAWEGVLNKDIRS